MLAATPLGALQPRVSFRSVDKPAASHHGSRPRGGPGLEPVVPPSFGSNARCFGGDALVSLLVPDALLIAAVNCRITSRLGPPTPFPLRWTGSPPGDAAKTRRRFCGQPGCCSLVCDIGGKEENMTRKGVQEVRIPSRFP